MMNKPAKMAEKQRIIYITGCRPTVSIDPSTVENNKPANHSSTGEGEKRLRPIEPPPSPHTRKHTQTLIDRQAYTTNLLPFGRRCDGLGLSYRLWDANHHPPPPVRHTRTHTLNITQLFGNADISSSFNASYWILFAHRGRPVMRFSVVMEVPALVIRRR